MNLNGYLSIVYFLVIIQLISVYCEDESKDETKDESEDVTKDVTKDEPKDEPKNENNSFFLIFKSSSNVTDHEIKQVECDPDDLCKEAGLDLKKHKHGLKFYCTFFDLINPNKVTCFGTSKIELPKSTKNEKIDKKFEIYCVNGRIDHCYLLIKFYNLNNSTNESSNENSIKREFNSTINVNWNQNNNVSQIQCEPDELCKILGIDLKKENDLIHHFKANCSLPKNSGYYTIDYHNIEDMSYIKLPNITCNLHHLSRTDRNPKLSYDLICGERDGEFFNKFHENQFNNCWLNMTIIKMNPTVDKYYTLPILVVTFLGLAILIGGFALAGQKGHGPMKKFFKTY